MYPENEPLNQVTEPATLEKNPPKLEKFAQYLKQDSPEDGQPIIETGLDAFDIN
jgi:hypothetical protein